MKNLIQLLLLFGSVVGAVPALNADSQLVLHNDAAPPHDVVEPAAPVEQKMAETVRTLPAIVTNIHPGIGVNKTIYTYLSQELRFVTLLSNHNDSRPQRHMPVTVLDLLSF
jgi:hypothetical protein